MAAFSGLSCCSWNRCKGTQPPGWPQDCLVQKLPLHKRWSGKETLNFREGTVLCVRDLTWEESYIFSSLAVLDGWFCSHLICSAAGEEPSWTVRRSIMGDGKEVSALAARQPLGFILPGSQLFKTFMGRTQQSAVEPGGATEEQWVRRDSFDQGWSCPGPLWATMGFRPVC